jgi:hypothetical protein
LLCIKDDLHAENFEQHAPKVRGGLVSLNQLAITVGILVAYIVDFLFKGFDYSWRWMVGSPRSRVPLWRSTC